MEKKKNIQAKYERIIKSSFLQPSYLDKYNLAEDYAYLPKVSAIVPTFNRCPHSVEEDSNPLGWCLESLLAQKGGVLDEIIVIDDNSSDYTAEVVKSFSDSSNIPILSLKNKKNRGSSISRNKGVSESKNDLVMFLDDDCIFSRYMLFGASYTMDSSTKEVGALHLPVYHRKTVPVLIDSEKIGNLDLKNGIMEGNFDGFPVQYAENLKDNFLNDKLKILKAFEIKNLGGVFLAKKHILQDIGGFPENLAWKNSYREETDVSLRLQDGNYNILFTPDPKFHCIHLKYGAHGTENFSSDLDSGLGRLITQSNICRFNTGNRVDTEEWFFDRIISTYVTLGQRDMGAAEKYLAETHQNFVVKNTEKITGVGSKIEDYHTREIIFQRAIDEGNKFMGRRL